MQAPHLNVIHVEILTKRKIAGMEPTRQTTGDLSDTSNEKGTRIRPPSNRQPNAETNQKTSYAAPALRGYRRREGVFNKRSPHHLYKRLNNKVRRYTNRRLVETTSTRLNKKTNTTTRKGGNLRLRQRLQRRPYTSRKHHRSASLSHLRTISYNPNRTKRKRP